MKTARQRAGAVWDMFTLDLMTPGANRPPVTAERIILAIEQAIIAAEEEATKKERARCLEMISRCVKVYQGYGKRAEARDRGEDPTFYPTVKAEDSWEKATGAEYAHFVVGDWSVSENFRDDQMPMPF